MVHSALLARIMDEQASLVMVGKAASVSEVSNPPRAVIAAPTLTTLIGAVLIFWTVRTKVPAAPPSTRTGVGPAVTVKVMGSGKAQKGVRITAPATMAAARSKDVASFPGSSM